MLLAMSFGSPLPARASAPAAPPPALPAQPPPAESEKPAVGAVAMSSPPKPAAEVDLQACRAMISRVDELLGLPAADPTLGSLGR